MECEIVCLTVRSELIDKKRQKRIEKKKSYNLHFKNDNKPRATFAFWLFSRRPSSDGCPSRRTSLHCKPLWPVEREPRRVLTQKVTGKSIVKFFYLIFRGREATLCLLRQRFPLNNKSVDWKNKTLFGSEVS
jgi:hypothetical protein